MPGFFYFSGLKELYEGLKKKEEKGDDFIFEVLVGLNIDKPQYGLIEIAENKNLSNEEILEKYYDSIVKALNYKEFDNKEFYEQIDFFIKLIENDRLIIRKTVEPTHSKLYIFKLDETQIARKKLFLTGSSNLTKAGLTSQREFNVEVSDYGVDEAEEYFNDLWENKSVKITEEDKLKLIKILKEKTLIREITPFEAYVWVIKNYLEYFERTQQEESLSLLLKNAGYKPYKYQIDAINQAISIVEKHRGVIIADVVGLGKSVIASAVARKIGKRGVVVCPPAIVGDRKRKDSGWWSYLEDFGLTSIGWEVWSIGDLEKLNEYLKNTSDIEIVIVDEVHRFRNEDTKGYELLKNICRGRKVLLLSATPFNNRPADILSILKLFVIPKKSTISLEDDLLSRFSSFKTIFDRLGYITKYYKSSEPEKSKKVQNYYESLFEEKGINIGKVKRKAHYLAREIRSVIEPVTIRRNRLDLLKNPYYKDEVKNLSKVADPIECFFELTKEQLNFYDKVINYFSEPENRGRFKGAMYRPFEYERKIEAGKLTAKENFEYISQRNLYDIMRRLLVKRFESSFGAFKQSIENFINITNTILEFVKKTHKYILDRELIEKIYRLDIDKIEEHLKEYEENLRENATSKPYYKVYEVNKFQREKEFLEDLRSDLEMFKEISTELDKLKLVDTDPKSEKLMEIINEMRKKEPERKVVIFSEYADTVKHIEKKLKKIFRERVLVSYGSLSQSKLDEIRENFDASFKKDKQKNDYDILISTDKLSEGINLNRAGVVINYDIPWNPVRVIQRVGRINRISKKVFDELYIINFFPTEKGADIVKSREIAQQKMFMIHQVLGEDARIFNVDEEPKPSELYTRINKNPEEFEEESFYTKTLNEFEEIKVKYPEIVQKVQTFPPRVKVAKKSEENEVIVFLNKYDRIYALRKSIESKNIEPLTIEDSLQKIKCNKDEKKLDWNTEEFWETYEKILNYKERGKVYTEQSLEQKALNTIKTLLQNFKNSDTLSGNYKRFLLTLKEDILDYGTLADYTLRDIIEIGSPKNIEEIKKKIKNLIEKLGEDYLEEERARLTFKEKEVIVAFYNRKEQ